VFTGSSDESVVAAEADTGEKLWRHDHHEDIVNSVYTYNGTVYSSSNDGEIIAADIQNGEEVWSLNDRNVYNIHIEGDILYYSSGEKLVAHDLENEEKFWTHSHHSSDISAIHVSDEIVYSGGDGEFTPSSSKVIATEVESGEKIWTHSYHEERGGDINRINSIQVSEDRIYSLDAIGCLAVEKEGSLSLGISRSLNAIGGFLCYYILSPLRKYWLVTLIIGAFVGSTLALLIRDTKKEEPDLRELEHKET